jgi:hypothetical protein
MIGFGFRTTQGITRRSRFVLSMQCHYNHNLREI